LLRRGGGGGADADGVLGRAPVFAGGLGSATFDREAFGADLGSVFTAAFAGVFAGLATGLEAAAFFAGALAAVGLGLGDGFALAGAAFALGLGEDDFFKGMVLRRSFAMAAPVAALRPRMMTIGSGLARLR
jgi:hypothetical protein